MTHDSKDDAIGRILTSRKNANDSKESNIPKKLIKTITEEVDGVVYETNTEEDPDSQW